MPEQVAGDEQIASDEADDAALIAEALRQAAGMRAAEPEVDVEASRASGATFSPAAFDQLGENGGAAGAGHIGFLLDVVLNLAVELGRTRLTVRDVLALGPGSIVELDRLAGEPVDIAVNGTRIAKGEVVVVDEKFAVRVTEILSPARRIASAI